MEEELVCPRSCYTGAQQRLRALQGPGPSEGPGPGRGLPGTADPVDVLAQGEQEFLAMS